MPLALAFSPRTARASLSSADHRPGGDRLAASSGSALLLRSVLSRLPLGEAADLLPDRHRQGSGDRISESIHDCCVVVVLVQSGQGRPEVDDEDLSCWGGRCDVLTVAAAAG